MQTRSVSDQSEAALVSSKDINGLEVYSPKGIHLGHIDHLMIDKASGNIAFAVLSFGGFLGIGAGQRPLPWKKLDFNPGFRGFVTDVTAEELSGAPMPGKDWHDDRTYHMRSYDYYGLPGYWL
jgi:hypothetical protein